MAYLLAQYGAWNFVLGMGYVNLHDSRRIALGLIGVAIGTGRPMLAYVFVTTIEVYFFEYLPANQGQLQIGYPA